MRKLTDFFVTFVFVEYYYTDLFLVLKPSWIRNKKKNMTFHIRHNACGSRLYGNPVF